MANEPNRRLEISEATTATFARFELEDTWANRIAFLYGILICDLADDTLTVEAAKYRMALLEEIKFCEDAQKFTADLLK
jgi:hypothetical protein